MPSASGRAERAHKEQIEKALRAEGLITEYFWLQKMPGGVLCPGILRYADMQNGQERIKIMTDIVIQGIGGRMGHVLCDMIAHARTAA